MDFLTGCSGRDKPPKTSCSLMNDNPFQTPSDYSSLAGPIEDCPHCKTPIKFIHWQRQGSPFEFKCLGCQQTTPLRTLPIKAIFFCIFVLLSVTAPFVIWSLLYFGPYALAAIIPLGIVGVIAVQWWTFKYARFVIEPTNPSE